jgi:hypothetical protein
MLSEVKGWYYGWKATLRLMIFDRETCRHLKEPFVIGDYGEVPSPDEVHQRWAESLKEEQTWEGYLEWLEKTPPGEQVKGIAGFGELDSEHGAREPRFGSDERE